MSNINEQQFPTSPEVREQTVRSALSGIGIPHDNIKFYGHHINTDAELATAALKPEHTQTIIQNSSALAKKGLHISTLTTTGCEHGECKLHQVKMQEGYKGGVRDQKLDTQCMDCWRKDANAKRGKLEQEHYELNADVQSKDMIKKYGEST
ncbi:hypothetical protein UFOVP1033_113 [uncultured Caudovirales phage]|uniref:Uncharacterized protein n=1 Tax=uncultured Caudovirales phage TaxID=2100421 RepID=A0A6J5T094_9CAUD|nr:hypothetical protein UFOVP1033_113 [uncultured Caudovirales phage]CAB4220950.1 hypothetical protein UFOVP1631_113 [uncultured Caudovirales phage]